MSIRIQRVAKLLQREIADVLTKEYGQDQLVTVIHVRVTRDFSVAYTHVSVLGHTLEQRQAAFRHLQEQTSRIRTAVARRIRHQLRAIPELRFFLDESLEEAGKMDTLFDQIREERAQRASDS